MYSTIIIKIYWQYYCGRSKECHDLSQRTLGSLTNHSSSPPPPLFSTSADLRSQTDSSLRWQHLIPFPIFELLTTLNYGRDLFCI